MKKEFIPYEQALELKELGFDEDVFEWFNTETKDFCDVMKEVKSPLYQQAFRWFREKYGLDYWIKKDWEDGKCLGYEGTTEETDGFRDCGTHPTYEEAELACLKQLIEILKSK